MLLSRGGDPLRYLSSPRRRADGPPLHYPVELMPHATPTNRYMLLCPGQRHTFSTLQDVVTHYTNHKEGLAAKLRKRLA